MSWCAKAALASLFAWLTAPVTVAAQRGGAQFGVAASATFPLGIFHSSYDFNTGWQGMAVIAFGTRHPGIGFRLDGVYGANRSNRPIASNPPPKYTFLGGDADLIATLPSSIPGKSYLLVGLGAYKVTSSLPDLTGSGTKSGFNVGGGFAVGALFFEARYVYVTATEPTPTVMPFAAVTAGFRFGSR